jgi:peroxiredoxin
MHIKRFLIEISFAFAISTGALRAQLSKGFEISGHIDGVKDGEVVKLGNRFADWHELTWMDSCIVEHGEFRLKSMDPVEEGPRGYQVLFVGHRVEDTTSGNHGNIGGQVISLFLNNGDKVGIRGGDINKMPGRDFSDFITIEGSPSDLAGRLLSPLLEEFAYCYDQINQTLRKVQDSIGFDRGLVQGLIEAKFIADAGLKRVLLNAPPSYAVAIPLIMVNVNDMINSYHAAFVAGLYQKLDKSSKNTSLGREMKENAALSVGQPFPEFVLPTPDGKMISSKEFAAKNKLTVIHFWGSNSYHREQFQKELRGLYANYQSKGLGVIGVSADSVAAEWKSRVMVEQYPWTNVSDLKGNLKGGIVNDVYHEGGHSFPNTTNVLVDGNGKIIAWDVYGVELQWYLWKYLGD